jgi:hypothetical protein
MMRRMMRIAAVAALVGAASPLLAQDCAADLVCAARPQSIADALKAQGFKAQVERNEQTGNPLVSSAASGYNYKIYFYGCEQAAKCTTLSFVTVFEKDGTNTPELANLWNKENRFSQMAVNDNGTLAFSYDVTTVGGLNKANFADVVDWWQTMLGQASKFFKDHPAK